MFGKKSKKDHNWTFKKLDGTENPELHYNHKDGHKLGKVISMKVKDNGVCVKYLLNDVITTYTFENMIHAKTKGVTIMKRDVAFRNLCSSCKFKASRYCWVGSEEQVTKCARGLGICPHMTARGKCKCLTDSTEKELQSGKCKYYKKAKTED